MQKAHLGTVLFYLYSKKNKIQNEVNFLREIMFYAVRLVTTLLQLYAQHIVNLLHRIIKYLSRVQAMQYRY